MCEIIPFPNSQDLAGLRAADLPSSQERPCRHGQLARGRGGCSGDMEGVGGGGGCGLPGAPYPRVRILRAPPGNVCGTGVPRSTPAYACAAAPGVGLKEGAQAATWLRRNARARGRSAAEERAGVGANGLRVPSSSANHGVKVGCLLGGGDRGASLGGGRGAGRGALGGTADWGPVRAAG